MEPDAAYSHNISQACRESETDFQVHLETIDWSNSRSTRWLR